MAGAQRRLAGTAFVTSDGVTIPLVGELEWTVSDVVRESMLGMDGYHGYAERPAICHMQGTFRDVGDQQAANFRDMINVTVVFELANRKTVIGTNMITTEAIVVNSVDATFRVRWEGPQVVESLGTA